MFLRWGKPLCLNTSQITFIIMKQPFPLNYLSSSELFYRFYILVLPFCVAGFHYAFCSLLIFNNNILSGYLYNGVGRNIELEALCTWKRMKSAAQLQMQLAENLQSGYQPARCQNKSSPAGQSSTMHSGSLSAPQRECNFPRARSFQSCPGADANCWLSCPSTLGARAVKADYFIYK